MILGLFQRQGGHKNWSIVIRWIAPEAFKRSWMGESRADH